MSDWENVTNARICNWTISDKGLFNSTRLAVQILVTVVSGSSLICDVIIFCYYYINMFKLVGKGSKRRLIAMSIACLSLADFLSCISHIQGVWTVYKENLGDESKASAQCGGQAVLAVFGTLASFLWIDVLVIVHCAAIIDYRRNLKRCLGVLGSQCGVLTMQAVCWGVPLFAAVGLNSANVLGYKEGIDIGWCYIDTNGYNYRNKILIFFFGRQLWAILTIGCLLVLTVCSILHSVYIYCLGNIGEDEQPLQRNQNRRQGAKMYCNYCCCSGAINIQCPVQFEYITLGTVLAVIFIFLRLPNIIIDWLITFNDNYRCTKDYYAGGVVVAAFGDSAIGLFNFIWIGMYKITCNQHRNNQGIV